MNADEGNERQVERSTTPRQPVCGQGQLPNMDCRRVDSLFLSSHTTASASPLLSTFSLVRLSWIPFVSDMGTARAKLNPSRLQNQMFAYTVTNPGQSIFL